MQIQMNEIIVLQEMLAVTAIVFASRAVRNSVLYINKSK